MNKTRQLKQKLKELLRQSNFDEICELATDNKRVVTALISMTYDKTSEISWRAIHVLGRGIASLAGRDYDAARDAVRRLLWSANDESGGFGCSVPEILGEVIRNKPEFFLDIIPLVYTLYQDDIFRPGVLYAIGRIGEKYRKHVSEGMDLLRVGLQDADAQVCGHALVAARRLGLGAEYFPEEVVNRDDKIRLYLDGSLRTVSLKEIGTASSLEVLQKL